MKMGSVDHNRSVAMEASRWYFSHLNPYASNETNIQMLRKPLVALTVKAIQEKSIENDIDMHRKAATATELSTKKHEEKKCGWREYLQDETASISDSKKWEDEICLEYGNLSRRTKARLEAFLANCSLCVPSPEDETEKSMDNEKNKKVVNRSSSISIGDGLIGFANNNSKVLNIHRPSLTEQMGRTMIGESADPNKIKNHQITRQDLVVRLELYIRTLQRVRNLNEACVIANEPAKIIRARARYTTNAFVATATYARNISPVLTRLLHCLTMEMLAVECVSDKVAKIIRRIVSEYEHKTSFASLAFLSTPEVNADSVLTPLIIKYLQLLQVESKQFVRECELERMLIRTIDPTMRKMFKTIEFQSIGHLLEVCHAYSKQLSCIELPPTLCSTAENVNNLCDNPDALRQALRDLRREAITVNGHVLPLVTSRKELVSMLTQTINSRTLSTSTSKRQLQKSLRKTSSSDKIGDNESSSDGAYTDVISDVPEKDSSVLSNSECESSLSTDLPKKCVRTTKKLSSSSHRRRLSTFHLSTIDSLTRRLLIAASRTGSGGDAYFFVKDLFGDDDVEVVPTSTFGNRDRLVRPGTIDILVRLASVSIKCHSSFDIYPKSLIGEVEPFIQIHTTTTESISLQEVRENKANGVAKPNSYAQGISDSMLVVREKLTDRTGYRTISIRPAVYERIETWNTPS